MYPRVLRQRQIQQFGRNHIAPRHMLGEGSGIAGEVVGKFHGDVSGVVMM
jgi:hypothetical protein